MKHSLTLVIPDIQAPTNLPLEGIYKFVKKVKPNEIVFIGDCVNFDSISTFKNDPEKIADLQVECDAIKKIFGEFRKAAGPKCKMVLTEGNHEQRLQKFKNVFNGIASLQALTIPKLFELKKYNIEFYKYGTYYKKGNLLFYHGTIVRGHSSYTAKAEFDKHGCSGISGHTHRLGSYYKTDMKGTHGWWEIGNLCDPEKMCYTTGMMNWQNGFALVYFYKSYQRFQVHLIPILDNFFIHDGYAYHLDGKVEKLK